MSKLAIITTHPVQYNAPLFAMLAARGKVQVKIFYTWGKGMLRQKFDPGFNKVIDWDIPLLEGYDHVFADNKSSDPGSHHFRGIDNPALISDITAWHPDAILVYGWAFKGHLKCLRYFHKKIPVFFRGDSVIGETGNLKGIIRRIFLKWVYKHVNRALYVGTNNKNYFLVNGMNEAQLVFVPHAIDNKRFTDGIEAGNEKILAWRRSLGIDNDTIVLLYAGKLDANKNVKILLETFSGMNNDNIHLIVAGNGVTEEELKMGYGQNKRIHFLPFQNQSTMPLLYGMSDIFVLPSFRETWGLSINEAMACGKAVLASSGCGAAADLVMNGINGYVFENNNVSDLRNKISLLVAQNVAANFGKASLSLIDKWSYEVDCLAIEKCMESTGTLNHNAGR